MVVRIRFGRGPLVTRRSGKNSRIARLASSLLTLGSLACFSLGAWRIATDLGLAGDFVFGDGIRSHWQVWIGAGTGIQYTAWQLLKYARAAGTDVVEIAETAETAEPLKAAANV